VDTVIYPKPVHTWGAWEPKGPARRLTGFEVAIRVMGHGDVFKWTLAEPEKEASLRTRL